MITEISPLDPTSPTFKADVNTFFQSQFPQFTIEINPVIDKLNSAEASQAAAASSAAAAKVAADAAMYSANASLWVTGTTYAKGVHVISPANLQTYARRVAGAGSTDPSADATNWAAVARQSTFTEIPVPALDINLALGDYHSKTIAANSTFTISNVPSGGSSFTLEITHTSGSIAFPASVTPANGAMPTLTTGKTHMFMFSTKNGGTRWRVTVAANFTN